MFGAAEVLKYPPLLKPWQRLSVLHAAAAAATEAAAPKSSPPWSTLACTLKPLMGGQPAAALCKCQVSLGACPPTVFGLARCNNHHARARQCRQRGDWGGAGG